MSSQMSIKRLLSIAFLVGVICIPTLGYLLWETKVETSFSDDITAMCMENFGERRSPLISMYKMLSKENVQAPYSIFDNRYKGESMRLTYDVLDDNRKVVHVSTYCVNGKYMTDITYDTTQEQVKEIQDAVKLLVGEDVSCIIADTYHEYIPVKAQGVDYRWKNGILERRN